MNSDTMRHLRHIATVTTPSTFWTLRTPRREVEPLVVAGYVVRHDVARDMYRITDAGIAALTTFAALQTETESEETK